MNDIDDFGGVAVSYDDALLAFSHLEDTFTSLGLESSATKDCPPSTRMVFLGLTHDTVVMTLEVPHDKLHQTSQLLSHWLSSPRVSKSELQSLIGKLSYVCSYLHLHKPRENVQAAYPTRTLPTSSQIYWFQAKP